MIDEKKILLELSKFERELYQFEIYHTNDDNALNDIKDDYNEEYYNEYIYIVSSISKCHNDYAHAIEFNAKLKLRIDKLKKIIE